MSCTTTTAMYLNVSTEICASASASRSGNTVTVSGTFTVTQGNSWNYNAIYAYVDGHTSWTRVKPYVQSGGTWSENFSFSFEDSGSGNPTYTAIFQVWNNAESGTVGNPASTTFSVSYPSGATTPPQPTVTLVQSYAYGAKFHVSGDYGTPSSASGRYIEAAILNQNTYGNTYRFNIASNTSSADITVTNSTYQGGGLTILPNKQYYYGGYINNTERNNSVVTGQFVTLPEVAVASITKLGSDMAQFSWSVEADGGHYDKTVSYSLDNGSYTTIGTYSGGSARSGDEVLLGLSPNTQYTLNMKNSTTAGVSIKGSSFTTLSSEPTITVEGQTTSSVTIGYDFPADGGAFDKTIAYTIDGGATWVQTTTITGGGATSGTFTISGLEPGHSYNLIVRVTTGAGTITLDDIAIHTISDHYAFYGPAGEASSYTAQPISKFYGPVNGVTTQASKVYAPVKDSTLDPYIREGGAGNIISVDADKLLFHIPPSRKQKDIAYIKFTAYPTMNGYTLEVYHTDSTSQYLLTAAALLPREIYNILGVQMKAPTVNIAVDYIDFPTGYKNRFKTKIVHQAFGHLDYSPSNYGRATYYSVFSLGGDFKGDYSTGLTIDSINHSQFYQFITQRNWLLSNGRTNMWFWMDSGNMMVSAERADGNWERNIPAQQVFQQGGISVTLTSQSGNLILEYGAESVDTTSTPVTVNLLSSAEYQSLGNSDSSQTGVNYTIGGNTVPRNAITGFEFGTQNTSTPSYFLCDATRLTDLSIPEGTCPTTIGQSFLGGCTAFNQKVILPDTTTIGGSFLTSCTSLNKRISIPKVTSIGDYFMHNCTSFNQYLDLPTGLTSIGRFFMHLCSVFNQDITLPQTLTSIGTAFMQGCNAFTQLVHLGSLSADVAATSVRTFCGTSSTAPCYVTGIGLIDDTNGTTVAAWKAKFPDSTTNWRKLVDRTSSSGGGN